MSRSTFLMAVRREEAEPTIVEVGETEATLVLDDGDRVTFDVVELRAALTPARAEPAINGGNTA